MSNNKKTGNPEDMSLSELLADKSDTQNQTASGPARVNQREDEPGSGMINLSQMVANSPLTLEKRQSMAPPSSAPQAAASSIPPSAAAQSIAPPPQKSSAAPFIITFLIIILLAGGAVAFIFKTETGKKWGAKLGIIQKDNTNAKVALLEQQLQQLIKQAQKDGSQANSEAIAKMQATIAEAKQKAKVEAEAEAEAEAEEAKIKEEADGQNETLDFSDQESSGSSKKKYKRRWARRKAKKQRQKQNQNQEQAADSNLFKETKPSAPKPEKVKNSDNSSAAHKTTKKSKAKTSELDTLLSGGGKKNSSGTHSSGALPAKLSRAQINAVMAKVRAKARATCGKFSPGSTVQVRMIVGSNGRVRDAMPLGAFAANPTGRCVAKVARTAAVFPQFTNPKLTFSYPISLK
jgi:hypothetical protein